MDRSPAQLPRRGRRWGRAPHVVVISHEHYYHLDRATVQALAARGTRFAVPLGIGAHLEAWGISADLVTELDWWQSLQLGTLTLAPTPSHHFSGRWISGADRTLRAGWSVAGPVHRVFFSGDTALHDQLPEIGKRLGTFDLAMIEVREYVALWPDVHLGPEQAVRASRLVSARVMLPVHWALFDLSLHGWTEPIERTLVAARTEGVVVAMPRPGERSEPSLVVGPSRWWPALPWRSATEAPIRSTGVDALMDSTPPHR